MQKSFTDLSIRSLPMGTHFDAKTPAFGIRIGKNRKTWLVVKGPRDRRVQTILGHYPGLSLADARKRALVALGSPHEPTVAPSFPDALAAFLGQPRWKPRSLVVLKSSLKHLTWTRPVDKITHEDVAAALDAIPHKSARAHALKDLRTFFNWCIPRYLKTSPCIGLKMPAYKSRERVLTDDELRRVWIAAEEMGYPFGTIVRLLILTGQRRGEIGSLKWEYLNQGGITLPSEITKNGREHNFPIGPLSAQLIGLPNSSSPKEPSKFLFLGRGTSSPYNGWGKHLKQLQEKSRTSDWTLHDLRRTFATGLASLNVPIHVTEKLLNHVSGTTGGMVGIYQKHAYWEEQKAAVQAWENRLQKIVSNR